MNIFEESCRICLNKESNCEFKFLSETDPNDNIIYLEKLSIFSGIQILPKTDKYNKICSNCVQILNNSYKFYLTLKNTDQFFIDYTENRNSSIINDSYTEDYLEKINNKNTKDLIINNRDNLINNVNYDNDEIIKKSSLDNKKVNIKIKICRPSEKLIEKKTEIICEICGKKYKHKFSLVRHKTANHHIGDKKFKCDFCGKNFSLATYLQCHIITHTGSKNIKCDFCKRTFYTEGKRRQHEKYHVANNIFKCKICEKSFKYAYILKKHMTIHIEDKIFRTKSNLKQHLIKGTHKDTIQD